MKFKVEYAKSGYSSCEGCKSNQLENVKIEKGTLRMGAIYQSDQFDGLYEVWHHIDCLYDGVKETPSCLDDIEGIQRIRYDDQLLIIRKINGTPMRLKSPTERITNELDTNVMPIIADQNGQYYEIYDAMNEKNVLLSEREKKQKLIDFLDLNHQAKLVRKRSSTQDFLAHAVDIITFGAIEACSRCSRPGYIFDGTYGYVCHSQFNGVKCNHRKQLPQRFECIFPEDLQDIYPILRARRAPTIRMLFTLVPPENSNVGAVWNATKVASGKEILKYGTVVDSLSGMENEAHVYSSEGVDYAVILSKTNIQDNKNSFYKLQLLESDDYERYWFFVHYGRIGTSGTHQLTQCTSLKQALDSFNAKYTIFTGETFGMEFFDIPNKYKRLEIDYSDEVDGARLLRNDNHPSSLSHPVQQLIKLCFDTHVMKDTMIELQLDLERIPLGKLSKQQIEKGFELLVEMLDAVDGGASEMDFIGLTNRFYTLIPHDFGPNPPPPINDLRLVSEKLEMLANLSDIQLAYSLLSTDHDADTNKSPIDNCYDKLKATIEPLDKSCPLFAFLTNYVDRTHAPTHNFKLIIEDIFKVTRDGEADRYESHKDTYNRYLLWHSSRITNFVGILKNGLKIAPLQAERSGDMFGNGIYFSDVVTKSAHRNGRHGLLLLCEVALGEMDEHHEGFTSSRSALRVNSVKGCGQTFPNPREKFVLDGVIVPCGNLITDHSIQSELKYNEYVVYDDTRVNIKFLVRVKFQCKRNDA